MLSFYTFLYWFSFWFFWGGWGECLATNVVYVHSVKSLITFSNGVKTFR